MKKIFLLLLIAFCVSTVSAQSVSAVMNNENPNEFGAPKEIEIQTDVMKEKGVQPIKISVEVKLVKPIVMGCQFIHRVTNLSNENTVEIEMYAVSDQKTSEKIKPGKSVELLTNTMSKCNGKKKIEGCINCEPSLNITSFKVK